MSLSNHCRPEVWAYYVAQLRDLRTTDALVAAASAVAWQVDASLDPADVPSKLDELARATLRDVRSRQPVALLAHLHAELFDERGFAGEIRDYYSPRNSLLPDVLRTKRGLPVILSLIYKAVGERIGLEIEGLNTPGHFLAAVRDGEHWLLVDPFEAGRTLTVEEASQSLTRATGQPVALTWADLPIADHPLWLARIIMNLLAIFQRADDRTNRAAMEEMLAAVVELGR